MLDIVWNFKISIRMSRWTTLIYKRDIVSKYCETIKDKRRLKYKTYDVHMPNIYKLENMNYSELEQTTLTAPIQLEYCDQISIRGVTH